MGKIKIATLGVEEEEKLREKQRIRREEKKKREKAQQKIHLSGMKGGERIKAVGLESEEEIEKLARLAEEVEKDQEKGIKAAPEEKPKKKRKRTRSKRYQEALLKIDHQKKYPIEEALPLLRQVSLARFDAAVEIHINTLEKGLKGTVTLPHGTGKKIRVAIADQDSVDKIIAEVEKGEIKFDALVAHPQVMPKLAKIAKFLGPRGLMPNPKNGTISPTPEKVAEKLQAGEINWKTESEFPIIHQTIGRLSFSDKQLIENYQALIKSIGENQIKNITLKSTISPGIKLKL